MRGGAGGSRRRWGARENTPVPGGSGSLCSLPPAELFHSAIYLLRHWLPPSADQVLSQRTACGQTCSPCQEGGSLALPGDGGWGREHQAEVEGFSLSPSFPAFSSIPSGSYHPLPLPLSWVWLSRSCTAQGLPAEDEDRHQLVLPSQHWGFSNPARRHPTPLLNIPHPAWPAAPAPAPSHSWAGWAEALGRPGLAMLSVVTRQGLHKTSWAPTCRPLGMFPMRLPRAPLCGRRRGPRAAL